MQYMTDEASGNSWRSRPKETAAYGLLDRLKVPYFHIDHPEAKTMKACEKIDEILDAFICKNLFLRNQQATRFYLLMMPADKKFKYCPGNAPSARRSPRAGGSG